MEITKTYKCYHNRSYDLVVSLITEVVFGFGIPLDIAVQNISKTFFNLSNLGYSSDVAPAI